MKKFKTVLYPVVIAAVLSMLLLGTTVALDTSFSVNAAEDEESTEESTELIIPEEPGVSPQSDLWPPAME